MEHCIKSWSIDDDVVPSTLYTSAYICHFNWLTTIRSRVIISICQLSCLALLYEWHAWHKTQNLLHDILSSSPSDISDWEVVWLEEKDPYNGNGRFFLTSTCRSNEYACGLTVLFAISGPLLSMWTNHVVCIPESQEPRNFVAIPLPKYHTRDSTEARRRANGVETFMSSASSVAQGYHPPPHRSIVRLDNCKGF